MEAVNGDYIDTHICWKKRLQRHLSERNITCCPQKLTSVEIHTKIWVEFGVHFSPFQSLLNLSHYLFHKIVKVYIPKLLEGPWHVLCRQTRFNNNRLPQCDHRYGVAIKEKTKTASKYAYLERDEDFPLLVTYLKASFPRLKKTRNSI